MEYRCCLFFVLAFLGHLVSSDTSKTYVPEPTLPLKDGVECIRECKDDESYHCVFNFVIKDHFLDFEDCVVDPKTCFGDGIPRQTTIIVNQNDPKPSIPAPTIDVCYGDVVSVSVVNEMESKNATIHWHGLHMKGETEDLRTQWADGTPYVTQCPIAPGENYTFYTFNAMPAGTFWFHSHIEFQRDDGAYGPLIIRETPSQLKSLPKSVKPIVDDVCDFPEHTIIIQEWYPETAETRFNTNPNTPPTSILVNGKGRFDFDSTTIPWPVFNLDPSIDGCTKYRFRLISSTNLHCPVEFSIEEHDMTVIASDGDYLEPIEGVSTIGITNAERYDFVIDTLDKERKSYEIRFGGPPGEEANCNGLAAIAFLTYESSEVDQSTKPNFKKSINIPGRIINPLPTIKHPDSQEPLTVSDLRSASPLLDKKKPDKTFYLQFGDSDRGAHINNLKFDVTTLEIPLLSQEDDLDRSMICESSYAVDALLCDPSSDRHSCRCFHILEVELGDIVEIFMLNPTIDHNIAHPIHSHGYWHHVLGSGLFPPNVTSHLQYVKEQNENGNINRNLEYPPRKDSLQTLTGGWVLTRFLADNPGYWIMHCHISYDQIEGQDIIFKVGNSNDWSIPKDFPTC